ncbi:hypothetical protein FRACA_330003 [Frankia canadensis]|uniref:Uncharacterized protein n=1 Tax=Frankia canadensis TaxID=1836972 RepID=A0A2I2KUR6_9ACTN|nr:hypothetical protein FRACA_330003 [Frankia canadensis]SOU56690.1 hypothetical protein FRACA_330003 [Frankia canadensis]
MEILRERGFGYVLGLDPPVRRRRRLAWPWHRAGGRRPSTGRRADGWVPDLTEYGDPRGDQ